MGGPLDPHLSLPTPICHSDLISCSLGSQEVPGSTECGKFTKEDQLWGHQQHVWLTFTGNAAAAPPSHSGDPLDISALYLECPLSSSKWDLTGTPRALVELTQVAGGVTVTGGCGQVRLVEKTTSTQLSSTRQELTLPPCIYCHLENGSPPPSFPASQSTSTNVSIITRCVPEGSV